MAIPSVTGTNYCPDALHLIMLVVRCFLAIIYLHKEAAVLVDYCRGPRQYSQVVQIEERNNYYTNIIYLIDHIQTLKVRQNNSPLYKNL